MLEYQPQLVSGGYHIFRVFFYENTSQQARICKDIIMYYTIQTNRLCYWLTSSPHVLDRTLWGFEWNVGRLHTNIPPANPTVYHSSVCEVSHIRSLLVTYGWWSLQQSDKTANERYSPGIVATHFGFLQLWPCVPMLCTKSNKIQKIWVSNVWISVLVMSG